MKLETLIALTQRAIAALERAQAPAVLVARLYVAQVFFQSGLTKLRDWEITLALFTDEYHVPLLPVLLAFGLGGRFAALGLSVVNAVAVISLAEIAPAALQQHILWACLLLGVLLWGPGRWSLDRFVLPRLQRRASEPACTRAA